MARCGKCGQWVEDVTTADGQRQQITAPLVAVVPDESGEVVAVARGGGELLRGRVVPVSQEPRTGRLGREIHRCPSGRAVVGVMAGAAGALLLLAGVVAVLREAHGLGVALGVSVLLGYVGLVAWDELRGEGE